MMTINLLPGVYLYQVGEGQPQSIRVSNAQRDQIVTLYHDSLTATRVNRTTRYVLHYQGA